MKLGLGALLVLAACNPATNAAAVDAGACVVSKALAGESVTQIASDCATDVATVLVTLAQSQDPKVQATPAAAEAQRARKALGQ